MSDMRRRDFITLLGGATTWPLAARAQQAGKVIRIGFIGASLNSSAMAAQYQAFLTELHELGFSEGAESFYSLEGNMCGTVCEVLTPCRGLRPHHVRKDRIGSWEVSRLTVSVA